MTPFPNMLLRIAPVLAIAGFSGSALACASCGCTLSSDWDSQGFTTQTGLKMDIRYDYLNQNQLRSGTGKISPLAASQKLTSTGDPQEVEKYTRNNYVTLGLDYAISPSWGVNVQLPWIERSHTTQGTGSPDGVTPGDGAYHSRTSSLGDVKVVGRYQGFSEQHNFGLTFGFKLPTGSHTKTGTLFADGSAVLIDPGLQPGSGTTDAILGAYYFDTLSKNWDFFTQASVQTALNSKDNYKPGTGYNLNAGLRYLGLAEVGPQIQLNTRYVKHDTGDAADKDSTGGTLVYLSPGVVVPVSQQVSLYGFVQLPIYQDVRGVQLTPRYTASVGARFSF